MYTPLKCHFTYKALLTKLTTVHQMNIKYKFSCFLRVYVSSFCIAFECGVLARGSVWCAKHMLALLNYLHISEK